VSGIIADPFLNRVPSTVNEKSLAEAEAEPDEDENGEEDEEEGGEEGGEEEDGLTADITIKSDL
jgi:hypothetical protein